MNHIISNNYVLKWQLKNATHYKFTDDGICINVKSGKLIKKVLNNRSVGYCVPDFKSVNSLRKQLELIPKDECPF